MAILSASHKCPVCGRVWMMPVNTKDPDPFFVLAAIILFLLWLGDTGKISYFQLGLFLVCVGILAGAALVTATPMILSM